MNESSPPSPSAERHEINCLITIVASSVTIVLAAVQLHLQVGRSRHRVVFTQSFMNKIAAGCCVTQLVESTCRLAVSAINLHWGMSTTLCNTSATLMQALEPAAQVFMVEYFVAMAFLRRLALPPVVQLCQWYLVVPFVFSGATVGLMWGLLRHTNTVTGHFTAHRPWCWIPPSTDHVVGSSHRTLAVLHFMCRSLFFIIMLSAGAFALVRLVLVESRGVQWSPLLRRHIAVRMVGLCILPFVAYTVDLIHGHSALLSAQTASTVACVSFPLFGAANAIAFIISEDLVPVVLFCRAEHHPRGLTCELRMLGCLPPPPGEVFSPSLQEDLANDLLTDEDDNLSDDAETSSFWHRHPRRHRVVNKSIASHNLFEPTPDTSDSRLQEN